MKKTSICFALLLSLLSASSLFAQLEGSTSFGTAGTSAEDVEKFAGNLRKALEKNDRAAVAAMFDYPVIVWTGKRSREIANAKELVRRFDTIFETTLRKTISGATVDNAWANYQGVMWDDGRIWIAPREHDELRIIRINDPAGRH